MTAITNQDPNSVVTSLHTASLPDIFPRYLNQLLVRGGDRSSRQESSASVKSSFVWASTMGSGSGLKSDSADLQQT